MSIKRHEHWESKLHALFQEKAGHSFVWGSHDCAMFVADAVKAATGTDLAEDFRGKYKTKLGSIKAVKQLTGGMSVEHAMEYVAKKHNLEELPSVHYAHRGDIVLFDGDTEGPAVGIVYLNGRDAVFVGPDGLRKLPVWNCRRTWRVTY